jgi:hypothetical protein
MLGVRGDVNMLFGTDWVETGKNKTFADLGMEGTVNMKVRKPQPLPLDLKRCFVKRQTAISETL